MMGSVKDESKNLKVEEHGYGDEAKRFLSFYTKKDEWKIMMHLNTHTHMHIHMSKLSSKLKYCMLCAYSKDSILASRLSSNTHLDIKILKCHASLCSHTCCVKEFLCSQKRQEAQRERSFFG